MSLDRGKKNISPNSTEGGEDWKRRCLAPGFMITPTGHVIHINEWPGLEEWMKLHSKGVVMNDQSKSTHGSPELDEGAEKLKALGADPGPTFAELENHNDILSLELKTEQVLVFEGGFLRIEPDGSGAIIADEAKLYCDGPRCWLLLPASEVAAIQEFLNNLPLSIQE